MNEFKEREDGKYRVQQYNIQHVWYNEMIYNAIYRIYFKYQDTELMPLAIKGKVWEHFRSIGSPSVFQSLKMSQESTMGLNRK